MAKSGGPTIRKEGVAAEGVMVAGDAHAPGATAATAGDTMRDTPEVSRDYPKKGKENGAPMWEKQLRTRRLLRTKRLERKQVRTKRRMAKWPEMKKNDCFHNIATNVANSARLQEECDVLVLRISRRSFG